MKKNIENIETTKKRRGIRLFLYLVVFIFLFPILASLLMQISFIQNIVVDQTTSYLSRKFDGEIIIGDIEFNMTYGLDLNDFILIGSSQDTIVQVDNLNVSLKSSLFSLYRNKLNLNNIHLRHPIIYIEKEVGSTQSNLDLIISKIFKTNDEPTSGEKLELDVKDLRFSDVELNIIDHNTENNQSIRIGEGHIKINQLLKDGVLDIELLQLDRPEVVIVNSGEKIKIGTTIEEVEKVIDASKNQDLKILINKIEIKDGLFSFQNLSKKDIPYTSALNYNHFNFSEINIEGDGFEIEHGNEIIANIDHISLVDDKGFRIKELKSENIKITSSEISLPSLRFITDRTKITDRLHFSFSDFSDFKDFEKKVQISANFSNSIVSIDELLHFVHNLNRNPVFLKNRKRVVNLDGYLSGTVNHLAGKNLTISIDDIFYLEGDFNSKNIGVKSKEYLYITVDSLATSMAAMDEIFPLFSPPPNFFKLGNIYFNGIFDGYFNDFKATGEAVTKLGTADLNMSLNSSKGIEEALYSGDISLKNFNLSEWAGNSELGILDMAASVRNGIGLTANSAQVDIRGIVNRFDFKGYEYNDFTLDGKIDKTRFKGVFNIDDEDIILTFDGILEMEDKTPYLAFDANVEKLDLHKLNLSKTPIEIKGDFKVDVEGDNIDQMVGEIYASNLLFTKENVDYTLDTLALVADDNGLEDRSLYVSSELFSIDIKGDYHLKTLVPTIRQTIRDDYPVFLEKWPVNTKDTSHQNITLDINVKDSENLLDLAGLKDTRIKSIKLHGDINTIKRNIDIEGVLPFLKLGPNSFINTSFSLLNSNKKGTLNIIVDSTNIDGFIMNPIHIRTDVMDESLTFSINTENIVDSIQRLDLEFTLKPFDEGYNVTFDNDKMVLLGKEWGFHPLNKLFFSSKRVEAENLILSDGKRSVIIGDLNNNKGLNITFEDFDLNLLNPLINFKKMKFSGESDFTFSVSNIFEKSPNLFGDILVEDFMINGERYGTFSSKIVKPRNQNIDGNFQIYDKDYSLTVLANYDVENNMMESSVQSNNFPLKIFEFIILNGIENTYGGVDLDATITGSIDALDIKGIGYINNAGTRIIYTQVDYHFDNQKIIVTEDVIDLTGVKIFDSNENFGVISGGLKHRYFDDFSLDVNISGEDVIALNTTKKDNDTYYGLGKGRINVDFTGPFHQVNMKIECETKSGSLLSIPISSSQGNYSENFITFVDKDNLEGDEQAEKKEFRLEGIDVEMDLTLTPEAQVNLIFDESKGDIIEGRGQGDLKIYITRFGDFNIYGDYNITSGKYLFTAFGLVAKPFKVRRGGQVRWTGDPVNATLNIEADYSVRAPLNTFVVEYLSHQSILDEASNKTDVNLQLKLGNKLFNPSVNFDLDFPNLAGQLKTVVDSKMRTLASNQNELNNQVLGLIVFNSFLPSSTSRNSVAGTDLSSAGISTLSEFVSSQLSILFTGLINEALTDDGLVSGIDFDIGLKKNSFYGVSSTSNDILPDEIEVHLKNKFRFLDERLSLNLGGNYVRAPIRNIQEYFIGDFVLEYFLTEDKKLKMRMYGKYDYDEAVADRKLRYGLGLGYRTEFGSMTQFKDNFKNDLKEIIENQENVPLK